MILRSFEICSRRDRAAVSMVLWRLKGTRVKQHRSPELLL